MTDLIQEDLTIPWSTVDYVVEPFSVLREAGLGLIMSSFTAAAQWGYCAEDYETIHLMFPTPGVECEPMNEGVHPIIFTTQLYFDKDAVETREDGFKYTGLFQSVMDMIHSEQDWSRVDETLDAFRDEGKIEPFVEYCQKHGLDQKKLDFALEGLNYTLGG